MGVDTLRSRGPEPVRQFSIFADNKVGRLSDIIMMLASKDIHIMSVCTIDTTDDSIIRLIVDYWEQARELFDQHGYGYSLTEVIVAEIFSEQQIKEVTCALVQAEINIHYIYPLLTRPHGKSGLVIRLEDNDLARDILTQKGIPVLDHSEIAR
ncbi:acetolactate synthase [Rubellicoccus peritrichatus]|uniref:Acetolactate synthase n=1 Tax=Rubellicoccus peritrichatus TaxID=3080537 RepID=A0AAQ3LC91_9BACT|nr:acetolactate synthase [Puniceicoccus sp. CR14]WOO42776.1 acetolactate synthase [Puniceicoccus sp. CR14]